jgi:hypothetical protein
MKTLDAIAIEHQTDRASVFTRTYGKPHDYAKHYDKAFEGIRLDPIKMLEIGVGGGEGIKMWMDYFSNGAQIFGVDNQHDTNPWDTPGRNGRYTFVQGDQSCKTFWACFITDYGTDWDIIIDDGSHRNDHIITTFNALWPHVRKGGFYAIEDIEVAYSSGSVFLTPGFPSHHEFIKSKMDEMNTGAEIDSIHLSKGLAIFRK